MSSSRRAREGRENRCAAQARKKVLWGDGRCLGPSAEEPDCVGGREKVGVGLGRGQGGQRVCTWDPPHGEQA